MKIRTRYSPLALFAWQRDDACRRSFRGATPSLSRPMFHADFSTP